LSPTQIERPFRIKIQGLGDDALLLNSFTGDERVSTPFRFILELLSPNPNVDIQGLLRKAGVISIKWMKKPNGISTGSSTVSR